MATRLQFENSCEIGVFSKLALKISTVMKASMGSKSKTNEYPAFTNFTIKVHVKNSWQDTVKMMLKSIDGVTTFRMEDDGKINISGYIDPARLLKSLKKAGKKAEMVHWQYGECSNNLFQNTEPSSNANGNGAGYGGYNGFGNGYGNGYGNGHGNGFENGCVNGHGNGYGYENGYGNGHGYGNGYWYGNGYGYNHGHRRNYAYNHLECSGNAEDCNGHHMEQTKISDKFSSSISKKSTDSQGEYAPKCCSLM